MDNYRILSEFEGKFSIVPLKSVKGIFLNYRINVVSVFNRWVEG